MGSHYADREGQHANKDMHNSVYSNNIVQFDDSVLEDHLTNHALAGSIEKDAGRNTDNLNSLKKIHALTSEQAETYAISNSALQQYKELQQNKQSTDTAGPSQVEFA